MGILELQYGNVYESEELKFEFEDGAIAIDCGANVGEIVDFLLEAKLKVYAFEPNMYAFNILEKKFRDNPDVICIPKGVTNSEKAGPAKLYLHQEAVRDQVKYSTGCSTAVDKNNVDKDNFTVVEMVGISDFIKSLDKPVSMLKIDVEGTEADILNDLFNSGLIYEKEGLKHVHLEWI